MRIMELVEYVGGHCCSNGEEEEAKCISIGKWKGERWSPSLRGHSLKSDKKK